MQSAFLIGAVSLIVAATLIALLLRRKRLRARELYQHYLEDALADGILTEEEADELASMRQENALSEAEVRMVALTIYRRALGNAIADSRITAGEDETLRRLQKLLGLSEEDLRDDRQQLQRVHLLARVERGDLPTVQAPVALDPGERAHWVVQARLAQKLTIPGPPRPALAHLRFRVEGGAPFHIDGARDSLASSAEILPLDLGMLIVTSRRVLFRGARKATAVPHVKLECVNVFADAIRIESMDTEPNQLYLLDDAELTAAILLTAARSRRSEVRGAPGRSA